MQEHESTKQWENKIIAWDNWLPFLGRIFHQFYVLKYDVETYLIVSFLCFISFLSCLVFYGNDKYDQNWINQTSWILTVE